MECLLLPHTIFLLFGSTRILLLSFLENSRRFWSFEELSLQSPLYPTGPHLSFLREPHALLSFSFFFPSLVRFFTSKRTEGFVKRSTVSVFEIAGPPLPFFSRVVCGSSLVPFFPPSVPPRGSSSFPPMYSFFQLILPVPVSLYDAREMQGRSATPPACTSIPPLRA